MRGRFHLDQISARIWGLGLYSLVAALVLWGVGRAKLVPLGLFPAPKELLAWWMIGALAALHRPLGGVTLGLGCLGLPVLAIRHGSGPAALTDGLDELVAIIQDWQGRA